MKKKFLSLFTGIFVLIFLANAQSGSLVANTGDKEFDSFLKDLNIQAQADIKLFNKNLSVKYNVPENKVEAFIQNKIEPADVFMIFETALLLNKPADDVAAAFTKHKDKGWGAIARELGIKPGSKEFHALKGNTKKENESMKGKGKAKGGSRNAASGKPVEKRK